MAPEADEAPRTRTDATRHAGHVVEPARPTRCASGAGGADMWQKATQVHAEARVAPSGRGDGK